MKSAEIITEGEVREQARILSNNNQALANRKMYSWDTERGNKSRAEERPCYLCAKNKSVIPYPMLTCRQCLTHMHEKKGEVVINKHNKKAIPFPCTYCSRKTRDVFEIVPNLCKTCATRVARRIKENYQEEKTAQKHSEVLSKLNITNNGI